MVSMLFSSESFTSSGRTPGSSILICRLSLSSLTSVGANHAEVMAAPGSANGKPVNASSRRRLSRCRPKRPWGLSRYLLIEAIYPSCAKDHDFWRSRTDIIGLVRTHRNLPWPGPLGRGNRDGEYPILEAGRD